MIHPFNLPFVPGNTVKKKKSYEKSLESFEAIANKCKNQNEKLCP